MARGVSFKHLLKVLIDLGAVVELAPEEGGGEEFLFWGECLPYISFFECVFYGCGVVARRNNVTVDGLFAFDLHRCVFGR